jgi:TolC family type I secretion outer membrane protein
MEQNCRSRRFLLFAAVMTAAVLIAVPTTSAETLNEALASAYSGNPTLRAQRANQRSTDELVPQALSGWRPTVTAQAFSGVERVNNNGVQGLFFNKTLVPGQLEITLSQPVFSGFGPHYSLKSGEANVEAGRQNLLAVEQDILFQATQAFMNVIRDRQILTLRQRNVVVLQEQLKAAQERFNVGEVTRTDVAQAQARLALSHSQVAAAQATLAASVASFVEIVGHSPGSLKYPKLAKLPPNLDGAVATAERINPQVLAAAFVAEAAQNDVGVARAGLLPSVSLQASALAQSPDLQQSANEETYTILGVVTIPLYEAGRVYSAVRQAKQIASQRRIEIIEVQRAVRDTVVTAWNALDSARQVIVAAKSQVSADELALEGVKQEYLVGSRTTLDVLDAEAELLLARETLVVAERDQVVAAYQLIASTGRLTADDLGLAVKIYDPVENYRKVRNKWFGTHANTVD